MRLSLIPLAVIASVSLSACGAKGDFGEDDLIVKVPNEPKNVASKKQVKEEKSFILDPLI